MDTRKTSISPLAATKKKATDYLFPLGERAKRAVQAASAEVAITVRDVAHVFRIIIFLRVAKDFPSILELYGVESVSENGWKAAEKPSYLGGKWFLPVSSTRNNDELFTQLWSFLSRRSLFPNALSNGVKRSSQEVVFGFLRGRVASVVNSSVRMSIETLPFWSRPLKLPMGRHRDRTASRGNGGLFPRQVQVYWA